MRNLINTYKPNIYSSTFMFWGLVWTISYLSMHHETTSGYSTFIATLAFVFGITSLTQLAKWYLNIKSFIK